MPQDLLAQRVCTGLMGVAMGVVVHVFHARRARTMVGPPPHRDPRRAALFLAVGTLLGAVTVLSQFVRPLEVVPGLPVETWALLLPATLAALALQVIGEEIVFRGYLLQQIAAWMPHPAVWLTVPAALFGLAHFSLSDFGPNAIVVSIWAALFGVALADLTARTGSIGAAIGVHLANNVLALVFVALPGPTAALALFQLPFSADDPALLTRLIPAEFALVVLCWLAARLALRR